MSETHDPGSVRSRRNVLAAAIGGTAAVVASTLARPAPVAAANGEFVQVGNSYTGTIATGISTFGDPTSDAFVGTASGGIGVTGESQSYCGVYGTSYSSTGVRGVSTIEIGVAGSTSSSYGVVGSASSGTGVLGQSSLGTGITGFAGITALPLSTDGPIGVRAVAAGAGTALKVEGRAIFSRSGRVEVSKGRTCVDVI
ncbi:MAG: hypothetical protein WCK58_05100, partial [Chloroflexota bacterium]